MNKRPWTFLRYFLLVALRIPVSLILSGTAFTILHALSLVSPVAKSDLATRLFLILNFPYHTLVNSLDPVKCCLDLNGVADDLLQEMRTCFQGRPRFGTGFVIYFAERRNTLRAQYYEAYQAVFSNKTAELRYAFREYKTWVKGKLKHNWDEIVKHAVDINERNIQYEMIDILMYRLKFPATSILVFIGCSLCMMYQLHT